MGGHGFEKLFFKFPIFKRYILKLKPLWLSIWLLLVTGAVAETKSRDT